MISTTNLNRLLIYFDLLTVTPSDSRIKKNICWSFTSGEKRLEGWNSSPNSQMVSAEHLRYKTKYTFLYCCSYFYLVLPARKNLLFEKRYSCLAYQIARRRQSFSKWQPTDFLRAEAVLRAETHFLNKMILIVSWQNFPPEIRTYIESGISEVFFKNSLFTKKSST